MLRSMICLNIKPRKYILCKRIMMLTPPSGPPPPPQTEFNAFSQKAVEVRCKRFSSWVNNIRSHTHPRWQLEAQGTGWFGGSFTHSQSKLGELFCNRKKSTNKKRWEKTFFAIFVKLIVLLCAAHTSRSERKWKSS